jgi:hypothetical protein
MRTTDELRGRTKNNRDTSIRPTYSARHKQANQSAGDIGAQRHIGVVGRQCASAVSRVKIVAAMMLSTAKARVLMRPARGETA